MNTFKKLLSQHLVQISHVCLLMAMKVFLGSRNLQLVGLPKDKTTQGDVVIRSSSILFHLDAVLLPMLLESQSRRFFPTVERNRHLPIRTLVTSNDVLRVQTSSHTSDEVNMSLQ